MSSDQKSDKLPQIKQNDNSTEQDQPGMQYNFKSLSLVKRARKQVEDDARLLANRIALLKQEEIKTFKKIDETKKKALEIYHLKQKNEERVQKKNAIKERQLKEIKVTKQQQKEKQQIEKQNKLDQFLQIKKEHTDVIRKMKERNKRKKNFLEKKHQEQLAMRIEIVKQQKQNAKQKVQEFYDQRKNFYKQEYVKQLDVEENQKLLKENEILRMERLEKDLIQKLQTSQILQKNAYEELESALTLPAKEFEAKYLKALGIAGDNYQNQLNIIEDQPQGGAYDSNQEEAYEKFNTNQQKLNLNIDEQGKDSVQLADKQPVVEEHQQIQKKQTIKNEPPQKQKTIKEQQAEQQPQQQQNIQEEKIDKVEENTNQAQEEQNKKEDEQHNQQENQQQQQQQNEQQPQEQAVAENKNEGDQQQQQENKEEQQKQE